MSGRTYLVIVLALFVVFAGLTVWAFMAKGDMDRAAAARLLAETPHVAAAAAIEAANVSSAAVVADLRACQQELAQETSANGQLVESRRADLERYVTHLQSDVRQGGR